MSEMRQKPQWHWIIPLFGLLMLGPVINHLPDLISSPWLLIQDDGRHFVAWLRKLADPTLFPDDPIERFFSGVTPALYRGLYIPAIWTGIDVVRWHMLMVIPASTLIFLFAADRFIATYFSDPMQRLTVIIGLAGTYFSLYSQGLPRSFGPSIVMLAISSFAAGHRWRLAAVIGIGACMYPAAAIVAGGGIACAELLRSASERSIDSSRVATLMISALSGAAGLAVFAAPVAELGPTVMLAEARELPIFQQGGRASYFESDAFQQISCGIRTALLPNCGDRLSWLGYPVTLLIITAGIWLLPRREGQPWRLLLGLCFAGLVFFTIATIFAFKAHLPARYSQSSIGLVYTFAFYVIVAVVLTGLAKWRRLPLWTAPLLLLVLMATFGNKYFRPISGMKRDAYQELSAAIRELPHDTLLAGTDRYLDNVPAFTARSVYAAIELSIPYKIRYYRELEGRVATLSKLFGETDPSVWWQVHSNTGIDMYLIHADGVRDKRWARSFPIAPEVGADTIFSKETAVTEECTLVSERGLSLVDARCFEASLAESVSGP